MITVRLKATCDQCGTIEHLEVPIVPFPESMPIPRAWVFTATLGDEDDAIIYELDAETLTDLPRSPELKIGIACVRHTHEEKLTPKIFEAFMREQNKGKGKGKAKAPKADSKEQSE